MIRFIFYGFLIYVIYRFIKSKGIFFSKQEETDTGSTEPKEETELIQDPQCGAYFLKQNGVHGRIGGRTLYFCSQECKDKYLKSHDS